MVAENPFSRRLVPNVFNECCILSTSAKDVMLSPVSIFLLVCQAGRAGLIFTAITIQRLYCTFDDHLSQQWLPLLVALLH